MTLPVVHVLDLESGNLRSLSNALQKLGYDAHWLKSPADGIEDAQV